MFQTPAPRRRTLEEAAERARAFGVEGDPEDHGTALVVRDRAAAFELFAASDSLRFTGWPGLDQRARGRPRGRRPRDGDREGPRHRRAARARRRSAQSSSVTHVELSRMDGPDARPETRPVAVQVNFRFELDGLPVVGPGAKAQVTFGTDESLLECYHFWRRLREARQMAVLEPEQAIERLRRDQAYAELPDDGARVVFDNVRLGYLALPPRELQGYLFPVYVFRGTLSTPELERYDHTRYVVAVDIQPEQIKRLRVAHRAAGPVI